MDRVNVSMKSRSAAENVIGILDIYGFEIFDSQLPLVFTYYLEAQFRLQIIALNNCVSIT